MLAICGNSFSYGTEEGTWPKILADKLNLPLLNMSACGASNYFTCYQIEHVLKYNPNSPTTVELFWSFEQNYLVFEKPSIDLQK